MRRLALLFAFTACAPPVAPTRAIPSSSASSSSSAAAAAPVVPLRIDVTSDDKTENCLVVRLRFAGELAGTTALAFRPAHDVTMSEMKAADEHGPVALTSKSGPESPATLHLELAPSTRSELRVQYTLRFPESGEAGAPFAESIELHVGGEDLLALPETPASKPMDIELELETGRTKTGGASSFGLGPSRKLRARLEDLRGAFFLGGGVGTAEFHATDGSDVTAWIGHTAFDPRWIGAEVAATRAGIDQFVGREPSSSAPAVVFLVVPTKRDHVPVVIVPRTRGFLVSVDRRASWNAQTRILVAQALAQRYLGGFLSLGSRSDERSGSWNSGFARAVGRDVVFEMGMIDASDRATELNQLLAAETFVKDSPRALAVRGALLATALDVELRKKDSDLRSFVRERLQEAARSKTEEMTHEAFRASIGAPLFDALMAAKEIPLPPDLLGKCWRLERKRLTPYELGFTTSAEQQLTVTSVVARSRAEAAGIRVGDVIEKLEYREGQPDAAVKLTRRRDGSSAPLTFLPAGPTKPGRAFVRVPGIPDDRC